MSRRYGRNQKRAARAEVQRLTDLNRELIETIRIEESRANRARIESRNAITVAFDEFVKNQHYYKMAVESCAYGLGDALAKKLNPYADELLSYIIKPDMPLNFYCSPDMEVRASRVVRLEIPLERLHFSKLVQHDR